MQKYYAMSSRERRELISNRSSKCDSSETLSQKLDLKMNIHRSVLDNDQSFLVTSESSYDTTPIYTQRDMDCAIEEITYNLIDSKHRRNSTRSKEEKANFNNNKVQKIELTGIPRSEGLKLPAFIGRLFCKK